MDNRNKGILLMILSSLFFALMATFVKLSGDLPTMQKVFFRNLLGLIVTAGIMIRSKQSFAGNNKKYLFYRSLFGLLGVFFYFFALDRLPLADAVVLNQMNPFFVLLLAFFFLKESIRRSQVVAILVALTGVIFIVKPQFDLTIIPALMGLSSSIFAASAYTIIRHLRLTDHPKVIVFYFTALSSISAIPFWGQFVMPTPLQALALLAVGTFATAAQYMMTYAYRYAEASDLSIYSYGNTMFSILIGIIIWGELPDAYSFLGILLILSGAYLNYRSRKLQKAPQ
ncbi:DMT family transporter [Alkaliphilus hydrothermalis]|uniref:Drug/metabolite transporter (DMT)-like permease n=1 Tax=Alkaliphilus hydrothermalis TaxID=1482730 RepID=A0ABS2NQ89_9FIRM|nr:DMT family transporter [Alkaliphilus hydrothermalis]MBM7615006.1 drug/metabolite transporter (DMT)-like permease [Alkaliphilus hydrothermalis]